MKRSTAHDTGSPIPYRGPTLCYGAYLKVIAQNGLLGTETFYINKSWCAGGVFFVMTKDRKEALIAMYNSEPGKSRRRLSLQVRLYNPCMTILNPSAHDHWAKDYCHECPYRYLAVAWGNAERCAWLHPSHHLGNRRTPFPRTSARFVGLSTESSASEISCKSFYREMTTPDQWSLRTNGEVEVSFTGGFIAYHTCPMLKLSTQVENRLHLPSSLEES